MAEDVVLLDVVRIGRQVRLRRVVRAGLGGVLGVERAVDVDVGGVGRLRDVVRVEVALVAGRVARHGERAAARHRCVPDVGAVRGAGAERGGVVVAADDVVALALHVAVAPDVVLADLVAVAGGDRGIADVAARGHRAVTGGGGAGCADVLVEVAAAGVDLLVHRVVDRRVAVVDVVVGDVLLDVAHRGVVVALAGPGVRGRGHVVVVVATVVVPVVLVVVPVIGEDERVVHVLGAGVGRAARGEHGVRVLLELGQRGRVLQQPEDEFDEVVGGIHRGLLLDSKEGNGPRRVSGVRS